MARKWTGVLCVEGEQTGDGRVIAPGAITWAELPLPLADLATQQHGDGMGNAGGAVVGTITKVERVGDEIVGEGEIDDSTERGAEICRLLDEGLAPLGTAWGISIDPDNWVVEIVDTAAESVQEAGIDPTEMDHAGKVLSTLSARGGTWALTAGAGDPDPTDGIVVYEDRVDTILNRFTQLRMRGATLCAIAAFDRCKVMLVSMEAPVGTPVPAEPVTAAARVPGIPVAPPSEWFSFDPPEDDDDPQLVEQFDLHTGEFLGLAVPLTIVTDGPNKGMVYGNLAPEKRCHIGYDGMCVTAPMSSSAYAHFMLGEVQCADGKVVNSGPLLVGCDHADKTMSAAEARDHYANTGMAWADVAMRESKYGPWFSGALRPDVTDELVRTLRGGGSVSGDWRGSHTADLIAVQAVSVPGFTIQRVRPLAASARVVEIRPTDEYALVASGRVAFSTQPILAKAVAEAASCGCGGDTITASGGDGIVAKLDALLKLAQVQERRTRHMNAEVVARLKARMGR